MGNIPVGSLSKRIFLGNFAVIARKMRYIKSYMLVFGHIKNDMCEIGHIKNYIIRHIKIRRRNPIGLRRRIL
jgi:hypothetical protein